MSDSISKLKDAQESSYFDKKNKEALARLKDKLQEEKPRLSPITGEEMEQVVIGSVVVDRCKTSGGIWLDAGELEEITKELGKDSEGEKAEGGSWLLEKFFKGVSGSE